MFKCELSHIHQDLMHFQRYYSNFSFNHIECSIISKEKSFNIIVCQVVFWNESPGTQGCWKLFWSWKVEDIIDHRTNKFKSCLGSNWYIIRVERSRLDGTLCGTRGSDCAAVSLGLAAASERTVVICWHRLGQVVVERLCESSDVTVVNSFFWPKVSIRTF